MNESLAAWNARQHEVTTHRTRKGRTTQRVVRYGKASVVGALDVDCNGSPLLAEIGPDVNRLDPNGVAARLLVKALERGEIGRTRVGLSALDIDAITRAAYGDLIPPVMGTTDVRQYEQVIHRDRSASAATTTHTTDITGGRSVEISTMWVSAQTDANGHRTARVWRDDTIGEIVAPTDAYRPHTALETDVPTMPYAPTDTDVDWPTRGTTGVLKFGRLPHTTRATDPTTRRGLVWDPRPMVHTPFGRLAYRVIVVTLADDRAGLPTTTAVPVPPTAPRMDWRPYTGTPLVGLSYGKRGGMRRYYWTAGVASVTRSDGSAVVDLVHAPANVRLVSHLFDGHQVIERDAPAHARTAIADRTDITTSADDRPTTAAAWLSLIERIEPGKRADCGDISVTFGKRGDRYSATFRDGRPRVQSRTAQGMANKLSA